MKKTTLLIIAISALCTFSCAKDRVCECTTTTTDASGNVRTDPADNVTFKEIKGSEARNLCQKSTNVYVSPSGSTYTTVNDCKLK